MKLCRAFFTNLTITLLLCSAAQAQTTLAAGDIAIIGYNYDASPQEMAIVTLVPIESGTKIYIADYGYESGAFVGNTLANNFEGSIEWVTTSAIAAGTVFRIQMASSNAGTVVTGLPGTVTVQGWKQDFGPNNVLPTNTPAPAGGENWFIYQGGTYTTPSQFVFGWANWFATTFGTANGWMASPQTVGTNIQVSYLPAQLTNGTNARALCWSTASGGLHGDNNIYNGTTSGTRAELLAAICDVSNWLTNETTTYDIAPGGANFPGAAPQFTVLNSTLPVSWGNIDARVGETGVILEWNTFAEPGNQSFTVQHSRNGSSWTDLQVLAAQGDANNGASYQYLHRQAPLGNNLYRIRQTDIDGRYTYSSTIHAVVSASGQVRIYPNPARKQTTIAAAGQTSLNIRILNSNGQVVKNIQNAPIQGGTYNLNTSDLKPGWYFIKVDADEWTQTIKLTIEP